MNQFCDSAFHTPRGPPCRLSPAVRLKWNMTSHSPATLWYMLIGPDAGCHDVPDPIAPIDITLCALEPTRTPMPSSDITISPSSSAGFDSGAPAIVCPACDSP